MAALTEGVGVQDVIDLIADQIMPAFGAQGLVLSTAESGKLRITGFRGYAPGTIERPDGLRLDTAFTLAGRALDSGIPAFFSDCDEIRRSHGEAPLVSGKQAWAFLPLITSGRPVGVCVLSYETPHAFTAEERAVLTSLGGLIAPALDRARRYDTKHELAVALQQALLPLTLPAVDGLRVAARYLPATQGAAVIGDVQGRNVAAAALMGQVRTGVYAHTARMTPEWVLPDGSSVAAPAARQKMRA
ncbi:GAF domain-containing protein [Streptomyces sp. NPDC017941]|uniref:GAF domain-containing protein n=1 Tax=Streptomyces sp. NPDC017941 TaxID=3365018 RepID=UPI0037A59D84